VIAAATQPSIARYLPFRTGTLPTPAGRLHYVDDGPRDAPAVVFLHGNPTWSFYWRHLMRPLKHRYRVIALDHLGCGGSDKPADHPYRLQDHIENFGRLVEHLGLKRYALTVHDWGGAIGFGRAVDHPDEVAGLTVLNTAAFRSRRIPGSIALCRVPGFGAMAIRGLNAFLRVALLRCVVKRSRLTDDVVRGYLAPYDSWASRVAHLRFVQDIPLSPRHPSYSTLEHVERGLERLRGHPMLILWGGQDFCFDLEFYEEWRQRFPDADATVLEDCGHFVVEDGYEHILPRMERWLGHEVRW
jgi:haloalkane dehalogenase